MSDEVAGHFEIVPADISAASGLFKMSDEVAGHFETGATEPLMKRRCPKSA